MTPAREYQTIKRALVAVLSVLGAMAIVDCDGCEDRHAGPCELSTVPEECGTFCGDGTLCAPGFFCSGDGYCTAQCLTNDDCGATARCNDNGICIDIDVPDGGDGDGDSDIDADADGNICADVDVNTNRVTPTVMLIIDQSASMTSRFSSSGNRWDVLRDSLLADPNGLIFDLQSDVRFGLALYSARSRDGNSGGPPIGECPMLETVSPATDNYDAIEAVYAPAEPIEDTPTGDALDAVLDLFFSEPDPSGDPIAFVLATDGEPDRCEELDPQNGQAEAIAAAERAHSLGIRTFIISVGSGTVSESHLQDMANAGLGRGPGDGDADFWVGDDDEGLRDALRSIVGGELSCELELNGRMVLEIACTGSVVLNGRSLPCEDPDGWTAVDETHIELLGDACDELLSTPGATLRATFPCDAVHVY